MLRLVRKNFEVDNGVKVAPGDIVDTSGWRNEQVLVDGGYLGETDAKVATKDPSAPVVKAVAAPAESTALPPAKKKSKKSVLAGHKRVFTRKATQGV